MKIIIQVQLGEHVLVDGWGNGIVTHIHDDSTVDVQSGDETSRVSISKLRLNDESMEILGQILMSRLTTEQILEPDRCMRMHDVVKMPITRSGDTVDPRLVGYKTVILMVGEVTQPDDEEEEDDDDDEDDVAKEFLLALMHHWRNDVQWYAAINAQTDPQTINALGKLGRHSFKEALRTLRAALYDE